MNDDEDEVETVPQHRHLFSTMAEARAFTAGAEWVNDSAVTFDDFENGEDTDGPFVAAVFDDEDADEDEVTDHRVDPNDIPDDGLVTPLEARGPDDPRDAR